MQKFLFLVILLLAGAWANASPEASPEIKPEVKPDIKKNADGNSISPSGISEAHNKNDKWFFYFGAGIVPQPKFDSGIQSAIDSGKQANNWAGEYGGVLELPGLYYRVGESTVVGLLGNFIFENYASDFRLRQSLGYDTYNISLSAMTSTGDQPGLGYFARFDFGPCDLVQIVEDNTYNRTYFGGLFEQLALGYGFQSSLSTRMLVHINAFYEDVTAHYQMGFSFNIGMFL